MSTITFKLGKNCHLFKCLRCWKYILPDDEVKAEGDGYVHAICKARKFTIPIRHRPSKPKKGYCQGRCKQYDTWHPYNPYEMGYKRCTRCAVFIKTEALRCPCCNMALRTKRWSNTD